MINLYSFIIFTHFLRVLRLFLRSYIHILFQIYKIRFITSCKNHKLHSSQTFKRNPKLSQKLLTLINQYSSLFALHLKYICIISSINIGKNHFSRKKIHSHGCHANNTTGPFAQFIWKSKALGFSIF